MQDHPNEFDKDKKDPGDAVLDGAENKQETAPEATDEAGAEKAAVEELKKALSSASGEEEEIAPEAGQGEEASDEPEVEAPPANEEAPAGEEASPEDADGKEYTRIIDLDFDREQAEKAADREKDEDTAPKHLTMKEHKKKIKKKRFVKTAIYLTIVLAISVSLALFIIDSAFDYLGFESNPKTVEIQVPKGSSTEQIAGLLKENGIISQKLVFRVYSRLKHADGTFQYGLYRLSSDMGYDAIIEELQTISELKPSVNITFPEGSTIDEIAAKLEENNICKAADFLEEIENTNFGYNFEKGLSKIKNRKYRLEGYIFPAKYDFHEESEAKEVVKRFLKAFNDNVTQDMYNKAADMGLTMDQVITLASIVQKEAPDVDTMPIVASVFINRLNSDGAFPKLESDPTRKYVTEEEDATLYAAYNTYICKGLPPSAICNPGVDAINAVLNAASTEYYYFCSNLDTKETFFAKTLAEHNKNLKKAGLA